MHSVLETTGVQKQCFRWLMKITFSRKRNWHPGSEFPSLDLIFAMNKMELNHFFKMDLQLYDRAVT